MMFKTIVIPYDGSEHAKSALEVAKGFLNNSPDTELHVISVVPVAYMPPALNLRADSIAGDTSTFSDYAQYHELVNDAVNNTQKELEEALHEVFDNLDGIVARAVPSDSIASGITAYAEDNNADLIIMGRRGLGALRGMLGSVSYAVLRSAEIPVLTVK